MSYYIDAFRHFVDFEGRANRKEYWMFALFHFIFFFVFVIVDSVLGALYILPPGSAYISSAYTLISVLPSWSLQVRRLHDVSLSGWWILLGYVPLLGLILLYFNIKAGAPGANQYGYPTGAATYKSRFTECPKCGYIAVFENACPKCGFIVSAEESEAQVTEE